MEILFQTVDKVSSVTIDGITIPYLDDYKIITSASGNTEVIIKMVFKPGIKVVDLATS